MPPPQRTEVRVRFAPSPTGFFHVGHARTALYNWLYARRSDGTFILRIEDTDEERGEEAWVAGIESGLRWLGLEWDEGPFRQSERGTLYREATSKLDARGRVYWCDCSPEDLKKRKAPGAPPGYDGFCRERGLGPGPGRALRFAVPREGSTVVKDLVKGDVVFENSSIEDFVVVKSSGSPLFVLANVVDDIDMGISHVIRGEDLLPNTPKAILVWQALAHATGDDLALPAFAHLPMLVNEKRQKLSKRRDPVALEDYRDKGYLARAMVNYVALLGWSPPGGSELITTDEMVSEFDLADVNNSPAFFDVAKLTHFNEEYIRALSTAEFIDNSRPWLDAGPWPRENFDEGAFERMAPLVQERVKVMEEVPRYVDFLFLDQVVIEENSWSKAVASDEGAVSVLRATQASYRKCEWRADEIKAATIAVGESLGRNLRKTQAPIRVAVTGRSVGPPLFESLEVLGRERAVSRIAEAADGASKPGR